MRGDSFFAIYVGDSDADIAAGLQDGAGGAFPPRSVAAGVVEPHSDSHRAVGDNDRSGAVYADEHLLPDTGAEIAGRFFFAGAGICASAILGDVVGFSRLPGELQPLQPAVRVDRDIAADIAVDAAELHGADARVRDKCGHPQWYDKRQERASSPAEGVHAQA